MTTNDWLMVIVGLLVGHFGPHMIGWIARRMIVDVADEHVVLVTRFGKLSARLDRSGGHFLPSRMLPWVKTHSVSLANDFRLFSNVHVNDARGTTLLVDLWFVFRIVSPEKALFAVENWEKSLQSLVTHTATSILGARDFQQVLHDRTELGQTLQIEANQEAERWGVRVERAFVRNVSLVPEVSRDLYASIAAKLEQAKAVIEEHGRLDVARLQAETDERAAPLIALAKSQYPLAIGAALAALGKRPEVLTAYKALYKLAQLRPVRTVAFRGFGKGEMRATDVAMLAAIDEPRAQKP